MRKTALAAALLAATAAAAHQGVKDPDVKARMDLMGEVKDATGVIGGMSRGKIAFDAAAAAEARAALIDAAARTPELFEPQATDPKTEARPEIWTNWDDFTAKSAALGTAAEALDTSSVDGLRAGLADIGATCKACHADYRMKK